MKSIQKCLFNEFIKDYNDSDIIFVIKNNMIFIDTNEKFLEKYMTLQVSIRRKLSENDILYGFSREELKKIKEVPIGYSTINSFNINVDRIQ